MHQGVSPSMGLSFQTMGSCRVSFTPTFSPPWGFSHKQTTTPKWRHENEEQAAQRNTGSTGSTMCDHQLTSAHTDGQSLEHSRSTWRMRHVPWSIRHWMGKACSAPDEPPFQPWVEDQMEHMKGVTWGQQSTPCFHRDPKNQNKKCENSRCLCRIAHHSWTKLELSFFLCMYVCMYVLFFNVYACQSSYMHAWRRGHQNLIGPTMWLLGTEHKSHWKTSRPGSCCLSHISNLQKLETDQLELKSAQMKHNKWPLEVIDEEVYSNNRG